MFLLTSCFPTRRKQFIAHGEKAPAWAATASSDSKGVARYYDDDDGKSSDCAIRQPPLPEDELVALLINAMQQLHTTEDGDDVKATLHNVVHEAGWYEDLVARPLLDALSALVQTGKCVGGKLEHAYNVAMKEAAKMAEFADNFAHEHPILTAALCAVVALGILYFIWPIILGALGFEEAGIVEGSFAAMWQSMYPDVPLGSVFAFLQRLGMTLK